MAIPHGLRAFRHRDFALFFAGQGVSQIGTWLQMIATSWLVWQLSGSAFLLGLAAFALQIPFLLLTPVAAVWVDRLPKRRVLFATQATALAQSVAMLALVATGQVEAWHLVLGNLVLGLVNAFDGPGRQAFLIELVDGRDDLPNAIAFSSVLMNGARFIGPMLGGAVIAWQGELWGFGLNALSYLAVLAALALIRARPREQADGGSWTAQFLAGYRYVAGFPPARAALLLLAATSLFAQPYQALAPWFVDQVYGGDTRTLGILIGAGGLGAVAGMVYLALRPSVRGLLSLMPWSAALAGAAAVGFAAAESFVAGCAFVCLIGLGGMLTAASTNTMLQTIAPDALRARVVSFYMMSFLGMMPVGAFVAGVVAEHIGPPATLAAGGALVILAAAACARRLPALRREIRPVYERLGL